MRTGLWARGSTSGRGTAEVAATEAWRGVAADEVDEIGAEQSALLRRRSWQLLSLLLAPYRARLLLAACLILVRTGGTLVVPYLVGAAIDRGIPAGDTRQLEL